MFEIFRNNSFKNYGLCPRHYLSAPRFSWDAIHEMANIGLELTPVLTCAYSLKKVQVVEFLIILIDTAKPTINI